MTDGYSLAISGLLRKRDEIEAEMAETRERLAVLTNDMAALERTLKTLGYEGNDRPDKPKVTRTVLFYRGELRKWLVTELRSQARPMTSRELAAAIVQLEGKDPGDRRMMLDLVQRICKALRTLHDMGAIKRERVGRANGEYMWTVAG